MSDREKPTAVKQTGKSRSIKRLLLVFFVLVLIGAAGFSGWYYIIRKTPLVYDPTAGDAQVVQINKLVNQGKTCQEVVEYIDRQLPNVSNQSEHYDLLTQKGICQDQYDKTAAIQTYQQAYKIGGVNKPVVGLALGLYYMNQKDYQNAKKVYLQLQTYYQNDKNDSQSIKDYQLKFIVSQLKKIEAI